MNESIKYRLYCASTEMELRGVLGELLESAVKVRDGLWVFGSSLYALTGVGTPRTLLSLSTLFTHYAIAEIVQIGIAGFYPNTGLSLCDVVLVSKDTFGDLGVETTETFLPLPSMGFSASETFISDRALLEQWKSGECSVVDGVTVNCCTGKAATAELRSSLFSASVESMEGAALYMFAQHHAVPALQIRALSNEATDRDLKAWDITGALSSLKVFLNE